MTVDSLKQTLRFFADGFVEYKNPSIHEKEDGGAWKYEVLSQEFVWHDESFHDEIYLTVSREELIPDLKFSPTYPSDIWLTRFADWFKGLSCKIIAYKYEVLDVTAPFYCDIAHVIRLEGLEDWNGPLWVEVLHSNGRW